jgi:uncharacterized protein YjbI with pentapeptide repeats
MKNGYSAEEINNALKNLEENLSDCDVQNGSLFQISNGADICNDYSRKSLKRINATNCRFNHSIFRAVAAVGARFSNVQFGRCDFSASNFQYCYFDNVHFNDGSFATGANFSHSIFIDCNINQINLRECTFFDCQFQNCTFSMSSINSITLENSTFSYCTIDNIDLAHLNLEFTQIAETIMNQVVLPPYQLAYVIGAPSYLLSTKDNIFIYTDKGKLTVKEYNNLWDDLIRYYYSQNEFFPLSNILIGLSKFQEALEFIHRGIMEAFDYFDFRMVKHFCKLAISCSAFSHSQLKFLYDLITGLSYSKELGTKELHSYLINIGEIRELLLNSSENKQRVEFVVKTNIEKDDLFSINELYNRINHMINDCCSKEHIDSIELRHNSPYELLITCIDTMPALLTLIPTIYGLLMVGEKALDISQKFAKFRKIHQEDIIYEYDKKLKELEIMEKEQALKKAKTGSTGIITVSEIEHNLICSTLRDANNIAPEYLHYKCTEKL